MSLPITLDGKVAVVTGAARGLGHEIARTLAEAGAAVALGDLAEAPLDDIPGEAAAVRLDVTDPGGARAAMEEVRRRFGRLDVLVNNAGIGADTLGMPFTNQRRADWDKVLTVNATGCFVTSREFVLARQEGEPGAIVNIASVSGRTGFQTDPGYSASKAAVINFTQCMARDLAPAIRVCAVCPGMIETSFYEAQYRAAAERDPEIAKLTVDEYFKDKAERLIPLRRGQKPRDIANAVAFLASDLAASITGQALNVDGGIVMS